MENKTHTHHKIAKSRGGTDDEWNLVEMDPYTHAYEHALDFVLFENAPKFDYRHEAWPLLPRDLQEAVKKRHAEWNRNFFSGKPRPLEVCKKISKTKTGIPNSEGAKRKMSEAKLGEKHPLFGKKRPEHSEKMRGEKNPKSKKVRVVSPEGLTEEFSCTKEAGRNLGCNPANLARWANKSHTPRLGKFAGYTFQYV